MDIHPHSCGADNMRRERHGGNLKDEHGNVLSRRTFVAATSAMAFASHAFGAAGRAELMVTLRMPAPEWALLQRELLRAAHRRLRVLPREVLRRARLPALRPALGRRRRPRRRHRELQRLAVLHALGGSDDSCELYKQAVGGPPRQYTRRKTKHVPFARDGMYYKEFPALFDWLHNSEGLSAFNLRGCRRRTIAKLIQRTRRFAGFYTTRIPARRTTTRKHKIIRSMFNGSRARCCARPPRSTGPAIRSRSRTLPARPRRAQLRGDAGHFKDYNDIVGDNPQNLHATTLALNAYLLTGEASTIATGCWSTSTPGGNAPRPTAASSRPTSGSTARSAGGRQVVRRRLRLGLQRRGAADRQARRPQPFRAIVGFMNAYLLTGDDKYLAVWRRQNAAINSRARKSTASCKRRACAAPRAGTATRRGRID